MISTGTGGMRWFKGDPSFVFHLMNAYTMDNIVTCDVCEFEEAPLFPTPDGTPGDPDKSLLYLKISPGSDHGCGKSMPKNSANLPLNADLIKLVKDWIAAGAKK